MSFAIVVRVEEGFLVAEVAGSIDGRTAPEVQQRVLDRIEQSQDVILDVSGVPYMSSAGFRMLLLLHRTLSARGGKLLLAGLSEDIQDTMETTGFLQYFPLGADVAEAMSLVRAAAM